jgi:hypothetical protein
VALDVSAVGLRLWAPLGIAIAAVQTTAMTSDEQRTVKTWCIMDTGHSVYGVLAQKQLPYPVS